MTDDELELESAASWLMNHHWVCVNPRDPIHLQVFRYDEWEIKLTDLKYNGGEDDE